MFKIMLPVNLFVQIGKENPPNHSTWLRMDETCGLEKYFLLRKKKRKEKQKRKENRHLAYKLPLQYTKAV